jgi:uncharacterized MAPEG superfamily protein
VLKCAEPYFKGEYALQDNRSRNNHKCNDWLDNECFNAKRAYIEALNNFNIYKSEANRSVLCDKKYVYKTVVKRKKRAHKTRKAK